MTKINLLLQVRCSFRTLAVISASLTLLTDFLRSILGIIQYHCLKLISQDVPRRPVLSSLEYFLKL